MKYISLHYILYVCTLIVISAYGMQNFTDNSDDSEMYVNPIRASRIKGPIKSMHWPDPSTYFLDLEDTSFISNDSTNIRTPQLYTATSNSLNSYDLEYHITAHGHSLYIKKIDEQRSIIIDLQDHVKPLKGTWTLQVEGLSPYAPYLAIGRSNYTTNDHRIEFYDVEELYRAELASRDLQRQ